MRANPRRQVIVLVAVIAALFAVMVALRGSFNGAGSTATPATQGGNPYTVWRICQERVAAELKAPSTADFPGYDERSISHSGVDWFVTSYVDAQNSFGAKLRTHYTCTASFNPGTSTYSIMDISVK
jgi:hypothetical protein